MSLGSGTHVTILNTVGAVQIVLIWLTSSFPPRFIVLELDWYAQHRWFAIGYMCYPFPRQIQMNLEEEENSPDTRSSNNRNRDCFNNYFHPFRINSASPPPGFDCGLVGPAPGQSAYLKGFSLSTPGMPLRYPVSASGAFAPGTVILVRLMKRTRTGRIWTRKSSVISFFAGTYKSTFGFDQGPPLHDALTITYVSHPELFKVRHFRVEWMWNCMVSIWQEKRSSRSGIIKYVMTHSSPRTESISLCQGVLWFLCSFSGWYTVSSWDRSSIIFHVGVSIWGVALVQTLILPRNLFQFRLFWYTCKALSAKLHGK